ncbi:unnamed protein product [Tetraodon nigroviridis]|uniref:Chromosome undetermined SCAF7262, whole genome shotgun sequence n=1 Tax=Tetraodon nigroviridis TaxID=99883 RepID=Q4TAS2_TETNG|nr:unnamed protein product [Tetraodon nigroviridis]
MALSQLLCTLALAAILSPKGRTRLRQGLCERQNHRRSERGPRKLALAGQSERRRGPVLRRDAHQQRVGADGCALHHRRPQRHHGFPGSHQPGGAQPQRGVSEGHPGDVPPVVRHLHQRQRHVPAEAVGPRQLHRVHLPHLPGRRKQHHPERHPELAHRLGQSCQRGFPRHPPGGGGAHRGEQPVQMHLPRSYGEHDLCRLRLRGQGLLPGRLWRPNDDGRQRYGLGPGWGGEFWNRLRPAQRSCRVRPRVPVPGLDQRRHWHQPAGLRFPELLRNRHRRDLQLLVTAASHRSSSRPRPNPRPGPRPGAKPRPGSGSGCGDHGAAACHDHR